MSDKSVATVKSSPQQTQRSHTELVAELAMQQRWAAKQRPGTPALVALTADELAVILAALHDSPSEPSGPATWDIKEQIRISEAVAIAGGELGIRVHSVGDYRVQDDRLLVMVDVEVGDSQDLLNKEERLQEAVHKRRQDSRVLIICRRLTPASVVHNPGVVRSDDENKAGVPYPETLTSLGFYDSPAAPPDPSPETPREPWDDDAFRAAHRAAVAARVHFALDDDDYKWLRETIRREAPSAATETPRAIDGECGHCGAPVEYHTGWPVYAPPAGPTDAELRKILREFYLSTARAGVRASEVDDAVVNALAALRSLFQS